MEHYRNGTQADIQTRGEQKQQKKNKHKLLSLKRPSAIFIIAVLVKHTDIKTAKIIKKQPSRIGTM